MNPFVVMTDGGRWQVEGPIEGKVDCGSQDQALKWAEILAKAYRAGYEARKKHELLRAAVPMNTDN